MPINVPILLSPIQNFLKLTCRITLGIKTPVEVIYNPVDIEMIREKSREERPSCFQKRTVFIMYQWVDSGLKKILHYY